MILLFHFNKLLAEGSGTILVQVDLPEDSEVHTPALTGPLVEIDVNPL